MRKTTDGGVTPPVVFRVLGTFLADNNLLAVDDVDALHGLAQPLAGEIEDKVFRVFRVLKVLKACDVILIVDVDDVGVAAVGLADVS